MQARQGEIEDQPRRLRIVDQHHDGPHGFDAVIVGGAVFEAQRAMLGLVRHPDHRDGRRQVGHDGNGPAPEHGQPCHTASLPLLVSVACALKLLSSMRSKSRSRSGRTSRGTAPFAMHLRQEHAADRHRDRRLVDCRRAAAAAAGRYSRAASPRYRGWRRARPARPRYSAPASVRCEPPNPAPASIAPNTSSNTRNVRSAHGIAPREAGLGPAEPQAARRLRHARAVRPPQRHGLRIVAAAGETILERGQAADAQIRFRARSGAAPMRDAAAGNGAAARHNAATNAAAIAINKARCSHPGKCSGRSNSASTRNSAGTRKRRRQRRPQPLPQPAPRRQAIAASWTRLICGRLRAAKRQSFLRQHVVIGGARPHHGKVGAAHHDLRNQEPRIVAGTHDRAIGAGRQESDQVAGLRAAAVAARPRTGRQSRTPARPRRQARAARSRPAPPPARCRATPRTTPAESDRSSPRRQ